MEDLENEDEAIKAAYRGKKLRQILLIFPIVGVIFVLSWSKEEPEPFGFPAEQVQMVGFALVAVALLFSFWNWRCPACHKYLGKKISHRFCDQCGVALSDPSDG